MQRREFLGLGVAALAVAANRPVVAQTQPWPARPVRLIVPFAPGGASDIMARPWADALSQALGQSFVVENRGGAGGMIGAETVARATPDGYTFLLTPCGPVSLLPLLQKVPYDPQKNFTPVGRLGDTVSGWVIHPDAGPKTFEDMIAYAKANPGKLSYGSAGNGSLTHMRLEKLKYKAGIDILHVPYRGSADALNDLLANNIQLMAEINPLPFVKAGKLTLLCINADERSTDFPETPTLAECGYPDTDLLSWYAIWAPAGTPPAIIEKFYAVIDEIGKSSAMKDKLHLISAVSARQTPDDIKAFLAHDLAANAAIIKAAHIKLE